MFYWLSACFTDFFSYCESDLCNKLVKRGAYKYRESRNIDLNQHKKFSELIRTIYSVKRSERFSFISDSICISPNFSASFPNEMERDEFHEKKM